MRLKNINAFLLAFAVLVSASLISCKAKNTDAEIQTEVNKQLADEAGSSLNASVSNGVVTLTGTCKDEECRKSCADEVKNVKGVKDVVNNITVATTSTAPVEVTADAPLQEAVNNVLKEYKDVKAEVKDGVVTLRGEIKRDNLQELMAAVNALKPKRVDNQLAIK